MVRYYALEFAYKILNELTMYLGQPKISQENFQYLSIGDGLKCLTHIFSSSLYSKHAYYPSPKCKQVDALVVNA